MEWQSEYLSSSNKPSAAERCRGLGILLIAASIAVAVIRCLMTPDEPIPTQFCLVCGVVAFAGFVLSGISARWQQQGSLSKALKSPQSILGIVAVVAIGTAVVFSTFLEARLIYLKASRHFKTPAEHLWYCLKHDDFRVRAIAHKELYKKYSPEELDAAWLEVEQKALETSDYKGLGAFIAISFTPQQPQASVHLSNFSNSPLIVNCDGPSPVQVTIENSGSEAFVLDPGEYDITVTVQGDYTAPPLISSKRIVKGAHYKAIYNRTAGGYIQLEDLAHR
ncbi:MAG: hypothetical protein J6X55_17010 [Victivallales bacterium]|nr:hypothetical protein [Victivallales bacterium]